MYQEDHQMMATILSSHLKYRDAVMMKNSNIVKITNGDNTDDHDSTTVKELVHTSLPHGMVDKLNEVHHHYA